MAIQPVTSRSTLPIPSFTASVQQNSIVEPLGGPQSVFYYLEAFPEALYRKSVDTNLYAFMRAITGSSGVGLLLKQFYELRAVLEEMGPNVTELDNFFGNPFSFARNFAEIYTPSSIPVILQAEQEMRSQDAGFTARAINYVAGARAGNTPLGIKKTAEAGLGYGVEIIENYKYLYDQHSDRRLELPYFGQTLSTEEFIVLPQPEISNTQIIKLSIVGTPTGGNIGVYFGRINQPQILPNSSTTWTTSNSNLPNFKITATRDEVRKAIETIPNVGSGNVYVTGDPGGPYFINFQGSIDVNSIDLLNFYNNLTGSEVTIYLESLFGIIDANEEMININSRDVFTLFKALDNIRPVASIPTVAPNSGIFKRTLWNNVVATSEFNEVSKFVTGIASINWPETPQDWVRPSAEIQAPRVYKDIQYAYQGWHNIASIEASSTGTATSTASNSVVTVKNYSGEQARAAFAEPLWITSAEETPEQLNTYINSIYPVEYATLQGAPSLNYTNIFWLSQPRTGQEYLIIDLGVPQAVNYLTFDTAPQPFQIDIFYDAKDDEDDEQFIQVTPIIPYNNILTNQTGQNPTINVGLAFSNSLAQIIFSRRIKITFSRLNGYAGPIQVGNLRIARNVA